MLFCSTLATTAILDSSSCFLSDSSFNLSLLYDMCGDLCYSCAVILVSHLFYFLQFSFCYCQRCLSFLKISLSNLKLLYQFYQSHALTLMTLQMSHTNCDTFDFFFLPLKFFLLHSNRKDIGVQDN